LVGRGSRKASPFAIFSIRQSRIMRTSYISKKQDRTS
jgi:hypothetical protein